MGSIRIKKTQRSGRTTIQIAVTPISAKTRALLSKFKAEVAQLEKKWKAVVRAQKKKKQKK